MITIDITLLIQIINFLISLFIINFFIIKPIRENVSKRRSIIKNFDDTTEKANMNAAERLNKYERRIAKTREQINEYRKNAHASGLQNAQATVEKMQQQATSMHQEAVHRIEGESSHVRQELTANIPAYSQLALKKILS